MPTAFAHRSWSASPVGRRDTAYAGITNKQDSPVRTRDHARWSARVTYRVIVASSACSGRRRR